MAEKKKKKKPSRFKRILKTLGKAALIGGGLYGASKMFGGRRGAVSTVGQPTGTNRAAYMPANLGETFHQKQPYPDAILRGGVGVKHSPRRKWTGDQTMAPNRDIFYKHGGKVTGVAKRGFGRALMKGKK